MPSGRPLTADEGFGARMMTVYLIRHAANDLIGKAIAGWQQGVHLNAEGQRQASRLADQLKGSGIGRIVSSPLERARETAAPLAGQLGLEIEIAEAIGELRFGEWTGRLFTEIQADPHWKVWNDFRSGARIPGGETMLEAQARFVAFLDQLRTDVPGKTVALFSHGDPIRAVLLYYLGIPLDFVNRIEISPASVSILRLGTAGAEVSCLNHTERFAGRDVYAQWK